MSGASPDTRRSEAYSLHRTAAGHLLTIHPALREVLCNPDGYFGRFHDLAFMVSVAPEQDGKLWLHASVSRRDDKMPTYEDLLALKHYCIGDDKCAYQVFPPEDEYFHGHAGTRKQVLHLWYCADGRVTPDFRREGPNGVMQI